jgi:hypothetical protein
VESDKVKGFGWFLLVWAISFIALTIILANLSCLEFQPQEADCGDYNSGYAAGYQQAISEQPAPPDLSPHYFALQLWKDELQIQAFLDANNCDRCMSSVPDEAGDPSVACLDRATCIMNKCRDAGFYSLLVVMNFQSDTSHAIIAFPTKDLKLVFVEPMLDLIVPAPKVGEPYLNKNNIIEKIGY